MAKKVKRLSLLIKGKNLLADLLNVKERRINRAVDAAIDKANEEALLASEKAREILSKISSAADDPGDLNDFINDFCDQVELETSWKAKAKAVQYLKTLLSEEVEEPEE